MDDSSSLKESHQYPAASTSVMDTTAVILVIKNSIIIIMCLLNFILITASVNNTCRIST